MVSSLYVALSNFKALYIRQGVLNIETPCILTTRKEVVGMKLYKWIDKKGLQNQKMIEHKNLSKHFRLNNSYWTRYKYINGITNVQLIWNFSFSLRYARNEANKYMNKTAVSHMRNR